MREQVCLFCGRPAGPDHLQFCDGRQGHREAEIPALCACGVPVEQCPDPQCWHTAPVLDPVEAHRVTEAAITRSDHAASETWKDSMKLALLTVAYEKEFLTSDDLWEAVGTEAMADVNPSALGSVFRALGREGLIQLTPERKESQRPAHHRKPLRVWQSLVYRKKVLA